MAKAMRDSGYQDVEIKEIEAEWRGPAGRAYLDELRDLHSYMPAYASLQTVERELVDRAILSLVDGQAVGGKITLRTSVISHRVPSHERDRTAQIVLGSECNRPQS